MAGRGGKLGAQAITVTCALDFPGSEGVAGEHGCMSSGGLAFTGISSVRRGGRSCLGGREGFRSRPGETLTLRLGPCAQRRHAKGFLKFWMTYWNSLAPAPAAKFIGVKGLK